MNTSGEGTILDVDKYDIMHRVQIHARDLRILDPNLSYPSAIMCREKVIILNLEVTRKNCCLSKFMVNVFFMHVFD